MTKLVPGANDFAMLQPLQWNTRYEVEITARNVKGLSEPTFYQFFMPQKPDITGKKHDERKLCVVICLFNPLFLHLPTSACIYCFLKHSENISELVVLSGVLYGEKKGWQWR